MTRIMITVLMVAALAGQVAAQPRPGPAPAENPEGEMRWALYVTLAPAWFDPSARGPSRPSGSFTPCTTRS